MRKWEKTGRNIYALHLQGICTRNAGIQTKSNVFISLAPAYDKPWIKAGDFIDSSSLLAAIMVRIRYPIPYHYVTSMDFVGEDGK